MRQNFPARQARVTSPIQTSGLPLSAASGFSRRYLVEVFVCALWSVSQSATANPHTAVDILNGNNNASHTPTEPASPSLCKPGCVTVIDFQSNNTPLEFSRSYRPARPAENSGSARWRHRYDIRLTRQNDDRIVFDHQGIRHLFALNSDGTYSPTDKRSGHLNLQDGHYLWSDRHATTHRFQGSFPVIMSFPDNQKLTLQYEYGQLQSVSDDESGKIEFIRDNGLLANVLLPDGRTLRQPSDPCRTLPQPTTDPLPDVSMSTDTGAEDPPPERCDNQQNPVPGFSAILTRPGVSTLDARPASCQSYFVEFYGTVRGEQIEAGLENHSPYSAMVPTNRSFPIVDFMDGNQLIVVRSRDVASASYNNPNSPNALYDRLMRDGEQIQTRALDPLESDGVLSSTENGRTTLITHGEQQRVALHVLIRQDMASAAHWQQIETARADLATLYGIRLQIVIIP